MTSSGQPPVHPPSATPLSDAARADAQRQVDAVQWFHRYEIVPGLYSQGPSDMALRAHHFPIPADLTGKRVLDIGCADGYFSFLAEARGATVMAIDSWPRQGFFVAHRLRNSQVEFRQMSLYDLDPADVGMFDVVFCFGVYYHLKKPVFAMERIAQITREFALLESEIVPSGPLDGFDLAIFHEGDQLVNDPSNWWAPTVANFLSTVRAGGFPRAELVTVYDRARAVIRADKGPHTQGKVLNEDIYIVIDNPTRGEVIRDPITVSGWTVSQLFAGQTQPRVYLFLDDLDLPSGELGQADYPLPRPDLAVPYGDRYQASGFQFAWTPPPDLRGRHRLHLFVVAEHGWNYRSVDVILHGEDGAQTPLPAATDPANLLHLLRRIDHLEAQVRAYEQNPVVRTLRSLRRRFPQT
jgi:tRNA (mo5U34)-methyltransferase